MNARRRFIRLAGSGSLAAALPLAGCVSADGIPEQATGPWQGPSEHHDIRLWSVSWAILAPNSYNQQPWKVALRDNDRLDLYLDLDRLTPASDPTGRQTLIGTGAFLGILELAAAQRGYGLTIRYFPAGEFGASVDERPVASIRFARRHTPHVYERALFEQVPKRHTYRDNYLSHKMPDTDFLRRLADENAAMARSGMASGTLNWIVNEHDFDAVSSATRQAWEIEMTTARTMHEDMRLLRIGRDEINTHRDGISLTSPMLVMINKLGLMSRTKMPAPDSLVVQRQIGQFNQAMDSTPALYWLSSDSNGRLDQLNTGRAYLRAHLAATSYGMVMHPVTQALKDIDEMADPYQRVHDTIRRHSGRANATVQMICRLGYPAAGTEAVKPAPRRRVSEFMSA